MDKDTKRTTIYLPERLHTQLVASAKAHKRSFNSEVAWALEQYLLKGAKAREQGVQVPPLSK